MTTPTTSDSGVYDGVAPPLTNPRDNFRRIERLRNEVRGIKAIQAKHERDILAFRTALESLERRVAALDVRTKREDVEERLALLGARVFHLESRAGVVTSDVLLARLSTLEEKLGRIEAVAQAVGTPKDDFTRIRGIGPKYARTLTELGVGSFADIAAWTDTDIDAFGKALGVPASRIRKSGWVASAKRLADKKDG
ncbi:MAG: hypothetical protein R3A78_15000 [Polyangiales bacterium]|nr:hypothetical protein [Myxococcales bacterium]